MKRRGEVITEITDVSDRKQASRILYRPEIKASFFIVSSVPRPTMLVF